MFELQDFSNIFQLQTKKTVSRNNEFIFIPGAEIN